MEKINCLVLEDEPLAADIIEDYIRQVPFLENIGVCPDAMQAMEVLQRHKVDVMFLDIHLPRIKGLDFLRTLHQPPRVIITTAYREYALDGYDLNVVDYLLKPIQFGRFLAAVNKLRPAGMVSNAPKIDEQHDHACLLININKKNIKIPLSDILYLESRREYVYIQTTARSYLTKGQLGEFGEQLPPQQLIRIHRSFIVSRNRISAFGASGVEIGEIQLPIGRSYKEVVMKLLRT